MKIFQPTRSLGRATFQINYGCQQKCVHCYESAGPELLQRDKQKRIVSPTRVVAALARLGFQELKLTGGEPMLSRDIGEVLRHATGFGLKTQVISNGAGGMDASWQDVIRYCDRLWISLFHLDEAINDRFTRSLGGAKRTLQRLKSLSINHGRASIGVHLILNGSLARSVSEVIKCLYHDYSVRHIKVLWPSPLGAARTHMGMLHIEDISSANLDFEIARAKQALPSLRVAVSLNPNEALDDVDISDTKITCNYGDAKLWSVDPEGVLYPCCLLTGNPNYQIGYIDLLDADRIWTNLSKFIERDRASQPSCGPLSTEHVCPALYPTGPHRAFGKIFPCQLYQRKI